MHRIIEKMKLIDGNYAYGYEWIINLELFSALKQLIDNRKIKFSENYLLEWTDHETEAVERIWKSIPYERGEPTTKTNWVKRIDTDKDLVKFDNDNLYDNSFLKFFQSFREEDDMISYTSVEQKYIFEDSDESTKIQILKIWLNGQFLGLLMPVCDEVL